MRQSIAVFLVLALICALSALPFALFTSATIFEMLGKLGWCVASGILCVARIGEIERERISAAVATRFAS